MSYDLHFLTRDGQEPPTVDDLREFFEDRPHYGFEGNEARYENELTGVYFTFYFHDPNATTEESEGHPSVASFNINYFRPHVFALEAAPEVQEFVEEYDLLVDDPQTDGMGRGAFSVGGFLRGWNAGNRFAYQACIQMDNDRTFNLLPSAVIERCWRWNYQRPALEEYFDSALFIPRIQFARRGNEVITYIVWGDAIPLALPRVDYLLLFRKDLSEIDSEELNLALVPWSAWEEFADQVPIEGPTEEARPTLVTNPGCTLVCEQWQWENETPHPLIADWFRQAPRFHEKLQGLSPDGILDVELVEESRPKS